MDGGPGETDAATATVVCGVLGVEAVVAVVGEVVVVTGDGAFGCVLDPAPTTRASMASTSPTVM